jgi:hypothetical protein
VMIYRYPSNKEFKFVTDEVDGLAAVFIITPCAGKSYSHCIPSSYNTAGMAPTDMSCILVEDDWLDPIYPEYVENRFE